MDLKIRKESKDDCRDIFDLNKIAFGRDNEAKLVGLLRDREAFISELSLVATLDNKIAGHILFTKIKIVDGNQNEFVSLALAPIAVKPDFQKSGIGGQLIRAGLDKARDLNFKSVIVLGHAHYYPKFGFVPATRCNIKSPFDVPANAFMALELMEGGLKNVSGTVRYPKEFYAI